MKALLLLCAVSVIAFGACSSGGASPTPSPSSPGGSAPAGLDGRTFLSTAVTGRDLVAGSRVSLTFDSGRVSASAGCNSMAGGYAVDGDVLHAGQLMTTEMACDRPLMDQDQWLATMLDGGSIVLDGDRLTLAKGGVTLTLMDREVADPDRPLVGTRWVVDGLITGDAVSSVPQGIVAALTFSDGRLDVEAGCNKGGGTVTIADGTLEVGAIALTKMACAQPAMAVEQFVTSVLSGSVAYSIEAGTLTLRAGANGLTLRATD